MNSLGVILHNKALAVGHTNVQMVTVLVVMQEVAFGGFYHNRTGMVLSPEKYAKNKNCETQKLNWVLQI